MSSSSTAAVMARRLAWAERMVRDDDASARGQLEREMFSTTISSDEQVLSMFSEWSQRTVPPHPLAELETALATRSSHRQGVKSIDAQLARTLELIRCTSSSRSDGDDTVDSEGLASGGVESGDPRVDAVGNVASALTMETLEGSPSAHPRKPIALRIHTAKRAVSPDGGDGSSHWVSHTEHSARGGRRFDQRPVEFGGVLELMQGAATGASSPTAVSATQGNSQRGQRDGGFGATSDGESAFPSPRLLQRAPDGIHHFVLQSAYSLKRLDYYVREDELVRQSRLLRKTGGRSSPQSPPSPQQSPSTSPLPPPPASGEEAVAATMAAPTWLRGTAATTELLYDGPTERQTDVIGPSFDPPMVVGGGFPARGWDAGRSTKATTSLDVSPLGLQALASRISDQLRCRQLSQAAHHLRLGASRGTAGSPSPSRSDR